MSASIEKPKNRRVFQWWLLVIGFWAGVMVAVIVIGSRPQPSYTQYNNPNDQASMDTIWLTATSLIQEATGTAAAPLIMPVENDPFALTATAIIQQATAMAEAGNPPPTADQDTIPLTATAFVLEATRLAGS